MSAPPRAVAIRFLSTVTKLFSVFTHLVKHVDFTHYDAELLQGQSDHLIGWIRVADRKRLGLIRRRRRQRGRTDKKYIQIYIYIYTSFKSSLYQEKSQWRHLTGSSSVCIENVHSVKITDTQSKLTTAKLLSPFPYTLRGIVLGSSFSFSSLIRLRGEKHDVSDFPLHTHYYTLHGDVWRWGLPFEEGEPLLFLFCWAVGT